MQAEKPNNSKDSDQAKEDLALLGARIRSLRKKRGYSNYEHFAYEHNFNRTQFGQYEQGQDLRYTTLVRIVRAFGLTMDEFFSEGFEEPKTEAKKK